MKKAIRILSLLTVPLAFINSYFSGCKKIQIDINNVEIMQDIDKKPTLTATYEEYTEQAILEYERVVEKNKTSLGEVDLENQEVKDMANKTAAKLFAYACYNERQIDKFVYFSNQEGETKLKTSDYAKAQRQEYYLRVNESDTTCGYRYHYTIKKVKESGGIISTFKNLFESARLRFTDKTNLLYRFEGSKIEVGEKNDKLDCSLLTCEWKTGKDWGEPDIAMKKGEYVSPEKIKEDIIKNAGEDDVTIRGNINVLAPNIVSDSMIVKEEDGGYFIIMTFDTQVASADEASLKMLRRGNSSDDCKWIDNDGSGLVIVFRIWENGLFRFYNIKERWSGNIKIGPTAFSGIVESETKYYYSYSDKDCDMTKNLQMLESAKALKD